MNDCNSVNAYQPPEREERTRLQQSPGFSSAFFLSLSGLAIVFASSYTTNSLFGHVEVFLWLPGLVLCAVLTLRESAARNISVAVVTLVAVLFFVAYHVTNRHEIAQYSSDVSTAVNLVHTQDYRGAFLQAYQVVFSLHFLYWLSNLYWIVQNKLKPNESTAEDGP